MGQNKEAPVFIIGCPRTGSKIYLNAISNHTDVNISPELHIRNPRWLHLDFVRTVQKEIGSLQSEEAKEKLLKFIKEERLYGSFWHMDRVDISSLRSRLKNTEWSFQEIFEKILIEDAENNGASRIGAKFPVHFSYWIGYMSGFRIVRCFILSGIREQFITLNFLNTIIGKRIFLKNKP